MIKIITPGKKKKITCDVCECVFVFEKEDVQYGNQYEYYEEVICPYCQNRIDVMNYRI